MGQHQTGGAPDVAGGRLHLCHIVTGLLGGPAASVKYLTEAQLRAGHRVTVVYTPERDDPQAVRALFDPRVAVVPWRVKREIGPGDLPALLRLVRLLAEMAPTVVHLHCSKAGALGRVAASLLRIPNVYSPRGIAISRRDVSRLTRSIYYGLEWILGRVGGPVVACSPGEREEVRKLAPQVKMIPNGLAVRDLDALMGDEEPARFSAADGRLHVAICGRIDAQKNPQGVARVAAAAPANWQFHWIGDGPQRALVEAAGITVHGWQERVAGLSLMRRCDALLHLSLWEGMPNAVLEAMALGLPVVASRIVGNKDLVLPGETGFLVEADAAAADVVSTLSDLAADPALRAAFGAAGKRRIANSFDLEALCGRWNALYLDMVGQTSGAVGRPATASLD